MTYGQVQGLTENTITLKSKSGKTATYPVTGTEQYYQNGLRPGGWDLSSLQGRFWPGYLRKSKYSGRITTEGAQSLRYRYPWKVPEPSPPLRRLSRILLFPRKNSFAL